MEDREDLHPLDQALHPVPRQAAPCQFVRRSYQSIPQRAGQRKVVLTFNTAYRAEYTGWPVTHALRRAPYPHLLQLPARRIAPAGTG